MMFLFLFQHQIQTILITHFDEDHYNLLDKVFVDKGDLPYVNVIAILIFKNKKYELYFMCKTLQGKEFHKTTHILAKVYIYIW